MFAFDSPIPSLPLIAIIIPVGLLALLLIELWLIIAIIIGRKDQSKLKHRIVLLFGISIFVFLLGQTCSTILEYTDRGGSQRLHLDTTVEFIYHVNLIEMRASGTEAWFNIIATLGVGASLLFWTFMRKRLGLDQNTPSTI